MIYFNALGSAVPTLRKIIGEIVISNHSLHLFTIMEKVSVPFQNNKFSDEPSRSKMVESLKAVLSHVPITEKNCNYKATHKRRAFQSIYEEAN